jgi:putative addiction module killer protein
MNRFVVRITQGLSLSLVFSFLAMSLQAQKLDIILSEGGDLYAALHSDYTAEIIIDLDHAQQPVLLEECLALSAGTDEEFVLHVDSEEIALALMPTLAAAHNNMDYHYAQFVIASANHEVLGLFQYGFDGIRVHDMTPDAEPALVVQSTTVLYDIVTTPEYEEWYAGQPDDVVQAIQTRLNHIRYGGNFGKPAQHSVGDYAWEMCWVPCNGLRVYYLPHERKIILLGGGDKKGQARDIARANTLAAKILKQKKSEKVEKPAQGRKKK